MPTAPETARLSVWHAVLIFLAGVIGGIVGYSIGLAITGDDVDHLGALTTFCGFAGQFGAFALGLQLVSARRGTGSWRRDYGFVVRLRDWWVLFAGFGLQIAVAIVLFPLIRLVHDDKQSVVKDIQDSSGAKLAVFAIAAGIVAPILEETLFRGLLLRALLRRMSEQPAVVISGVAFGAVHVLLDPRLGTLVVMPGIVALGIVSGVMAVRTGTLSRSILLHVGFNALTVITSIAGVLSLH
jgi:membrane protease YdiL (CAAX protease family)